MHWIAREELISRISVSHIIMSVMNSLSTKCSLGIMKETGVLTSWSRLVSKISFLGFVLLESNRNYLASHLILMKVCLGRAGLAQWWQFSPSTNVALVRFLDLPSYADWLCWFSTLFWQVFPRGLLFSALTKSNVWCNLSWFSLISNLLN